MTPTTHFYEGEQYGIGFPIDMPVMLTYFDLGEKSTSQ
jgi:hypothetical protein